MRQGNNVEQSSRTTGRSKPHEALYSWIEVGVISLAEGIVCSGYGDKFITI